MTNTHDPQTNVGDGLGRSGASGSYSNGAIAQTLSDEPVPATRVERIVALKISRATSSGPLQITKDATVAEMTSNGESG